MHVINARNVHEALPKALELLRSEGVARSSRNGPVLVAPGPVTTVYEKPTERVLFWKQRDANPFFHFFESLWMLAGRDDVKYVERFAANMKNYSDDGKRFHGAYGYRWKNHFGASRDIRAGDGLMLDQVNTIIAILKANPDDRRCVLQMWDPTSDLGAVGKDFPCNTNAYFSINADLALDMTVCNRSNDIVWGCYGANAVHFSVLQEYVASSVGVPVGRYWQVSNNWHGYRDTVEPLWSLADEVPDGYRRQPMWNPYAETSIKVSPFPLFDEGQSKESWDRDLTLFMEDPLCYGFEGTFFSKVAKPMWATHAKYKSAKNLQDRLDAMDLAVRIEAKDWSYACWRWLQKRVEAYKAKHGEEAADERLV